LTQNASGTNVSSKNIRRKLLTTKKKKWENKLPILSWWGSTKRDTIQDSQTMRRSKIRDWGERDCTTLASGAEGEVGAKRFGVASGGSKQGKYFGPGELGFKIKRMLSNTGLVKNQENRLSKRCKYGRPGGTGELVKKKICSAGACKFQDQEGGVEPDHVTSGKKKVEEMIGAEIRDRNTIQKRTGGVRELVAVGSGNRKD